MRIDLLDPPKWIGTADDGSKIYSDRAYVDDSDGIDVFLGYGIPELSNNQTDETKSQQSL